MSIIFHESSKTFHLYNNNISYIMTVLPNGHLGNLYFGKRIHDREDFSYLLEMKQRAMTACVYEGNRKFSLEHLKLEYPVYGSSDYRYRQWKSFRKTAAGSRNLLMSVTLLQMESQSFQDFRLPIRRMTKKPRPYV